MKGKRKPERHHACRNSGNGSQSWPSSSALRRPCTRTCWLDERLKGQLPNLRSISSTFARKLSRATRRFASASRRRQAAAATSSTPAHRANASCAGNPVAQCTGRLRRSRPYSSTPAARSCDCRAMWPRCSFIRCAARFHRLARCSCRAPRHGDSACRQHDGPYTHLLCARPSERPCRLLAGQDPARIDERQRKADERRRIVLPALRTALIIDTYGHAVPLAGRRRWVMGFTLMELMMVMVVIAVLAAVALPAYQGQIRKSRRADAVTRCRRYSRRRSDTAPTRTTTPTISSSLAPA